jgi:hypothetical protein
LSYPGTPIKGTNYEMKHHLKINNKIIAQIPLKLGREIVENKLRQEPSTSLSAKVTERQLHLQYIQTQHFI